MIKSMTGFGQAVDELHGLTIEVRCLNSKFLDLSLRLPKLLAAKEYEIRKIISSVVVRGKVAVSVVLDPLIHATDLYDAQEFEAHYQALIELANKVQAPHNGIFQLALSKAEDSKTETSQLSEETWRTFQNALAKAMERSEDFRAVEGAAMENKIRSYINQIAEHLQQVVELDSGRLEVIRKRIKASVTEFFGSDKFDDNRMEQEIIFYIEKLDIHEECVRLKTHLNYFSKVMDNPQSSGKKLGFITQEIGREINTIGSKANDATMQKHVVSMKEELEKIKEQLGNVL